jgi:serine/alanine adding enzyme
MPVKIVHRLDLAQWRDSVEGHPHGNIFHTPEMFQVFEQVKGYDPRLWAAVDDDARLLALLLPVKVTVMGGPFSWLTARSIVYGGALCELSPRGKTALGQLLSACNQEGSLGSVFTEVRNRTDTELAQPVLQRSGYTYQAYENFLIDLNLPVE